METAGISSKVERLQCKPQLLGTSTKLGTCTKSYPKIPQLVSKSSTDLTIRDNGLKEGGNVTKSSTNTYFLILFIFPFMTFTWLHPWFITYPTLQEYLGLLLISTSRAVIVLYIVNSHCLHFHYNTLFFFLSRLSHDHMLHSSYSRNCHLHYCSYCSLLSSSSISISTDHSSINT